MRGMQYAVAVAGVVGGLTGTAVIHAASSETAPSQVAVVERAIRLQIPDVERTFRVGEALPFLQRNSRYVVGILPAQGNEPARAVAVNARPRLPVWFTDDGEMRFGYETESASGYLELTVGERWPVVGQDESSWTIRVGNQNGQVELSLPKKERGIRIETEKPSAPPSLVLKLPPPEKVTPPAPGPKPGPKSGSGVTTPKPPDPATPPKETTPGPDTMPETTPEAPEDGASAGAPDKPKAESMLSAWVAYVRHDWKRLVTESLVLSLPIPFLLALWGLIRARRAQKARAPARPVKERRKKVKEKPAPTPPTPPAPATPAAVKPPVKTAAKLAPLAGALAPKLAPAAAAEAPVSLPVPPPKAAVSGPPVPLPPSAGAPSHPPTPPPEAKAKVESTIRRTILAPPVPETKPATTSETTIVKTVVPVVPKPVEPPPPAGKSTVHRDLTAPSQKAKAHGPLVPPEEPVPELTAPVYFTPDAEEKVERKTIHPKKKLVVQSETLKTQAPVAARPRPMPVLAEPTDEELQSRLASLRRPTQLGSEPEEAEREKSSTTVARQRPAPVVSAPPIDAIGPYQILERIGQGSAGVVYKAFQPDLQRTVALKLLLGGQHADPDQKERFMREARALAKLRHPNIVTVFEVGEHAGQPYISMEYIAGPTLDALIAGVPRKREEILSLCIPIVDALHYAHRQGIIHRDLKPGNILLTADRQPVITDFGLARNLEEQMRSVSGDIVGTPSYMPPEQAMGKTDETDVRSDVYSLGAILYALLTGKEPFKGATLLETLTAVIRDELMPPDLVCPTADKNIAAICEKAMRKDPASRYQSAGEMLTMLRSCL